MVLHGIGYRRQRELLEPLVLGEILGLQEPQVQLATMVFVVLQVLRVQLATMVFVVLQEPQVPQEMMDLKDQQVPQEMMVLAV
jgi:hypothetical protein